MSNLFRFSLILALVFSGAKVFGYESNGTRNQSNTASASRYQVSGDRQGQVTVTDKVSRQVIRTFQMETGVVVRETFLLDNGRTVAASQKDLTILWDLATGNEIKRFPLRIYGFSHDQTKFFTWWAGKALLYSYPNMTQRCRLSEYTAGGPYEFHFSPDDRFLVSSFFNAMPSDDQNYPYPNMVMPGFRETKLFNLQTCKESQEFSRMQFSGIGEFSPDSRFYYLKNAVVTLDGDLLRGLFRFDLMTYQVRKLAE